MFAELTSLQKQGNIARGYGKAELKKTKPQTSTFDKKYLNVVKEYLELQEKQVKALL